MAGDRAVFVKGKWVYYLNGKEVSQKAYENVYPPPPPAKQGEAFMGTPLKGWPLTSNAMAVHPDSVDEARNLDKSLGVPTEYTTEGQPIFENRAHRRRFLRAHQFHDKDGGYGD